MGIKLTYREVEAILKANGFECVRIEGSHHTYKGIVNKGTRVVTVPFYKDIQDMRIINSIIRQSGLSKEEFYKSTKRTGKRLPGKTSKSEA